MNRGGERLRELCERIKARMDYRHFYARYNLRFDGSRAMCPLEAHRHSGKGAASLSIDWRRGLFHCFSRDEGGDAIRFYELMHGVSFAQAVSTLARELGVDDQTDTESAVKSAASSLRVRAMPDTVDTPDAERVINPAQRTAICEAFLETVRCENQEEGLRYLERRGIKRETSRRFGINYFPRDAYRRVMKRMLDGFAPDALQACGLFNSKQHLTFYQHRLLFPFYVERQVTYLQARTIAERVKPRWHNLRGSVPAFYNADVLDELVSGETVFIVEGFTDTLTLATHGFHAVGLVGASGLREDWLPPLARFRVVLALDPDVAGQRAAAKYRRMFGERNMSLATLELATDVNDFFRTHSRREFELLTARAIERDLKNVFCGTSDS